MIAWLTHPNKDPKKPLDDVSFFSASAISMLAFCSLSPILARASKHDKEENFHFIQNSSIVIDEIVGIFTATWLQYHINQFSQIINFYN